MGFLCFFLTSRRFVASFRGQVQDRRNAGVISQDTRYMFQMLRVTMRATAPPPPSPSSLLASDRGCWWCQACSWNVDTRSDSSSPGELTIKMLLLISILCVLFGLTLMYGPTSRNAIQIKSVWHSLYKSNTLLIRFNRTFFVKLDKMFCHFKNIAI